MTGVLSATGEIVSLDVPYLVGEDQKLNHFERALLVLQSAYKAKADKDWAAVLRILKDSGFDRMPDELAIRFYYLEGLSRAAQDDDVAAEIAFRHALDHVTPQTDDMSVALLHQHLAQALHNQQRFPEAIDERNRSLTALDKPEAQNDRWRIDMRYENLREIAGERLCLCQFEGGLDALNRAWNILEPLPAPVSEQDQRRRYKLLWVMALMNRWMAAPQTAYNCARAALTIFDDLRARMSQSATVETDNDSFSYARLEVVATDCLLDTKPIRQLGGSRPENLVTAQSLIADALLRFRRPQDLAWPRGKAVNSDPAGLALAQLAELRAERFAQYDNRAERLQRLWDMQQALAASAVPDLALIGQANLALADEYAYQGDAIHARIYFSRAIDYLNQVAPILALRAKNALEHNGEFPSDMM